MTGIQSAIRSITVFLLVLLTATVVLAAERRRTASAGRVIFQDDFSSNVNDWYEADTSDAYIKVTGGKYVFEHKRSIDSWSSWRSAGIDASKDYTIEATLQKVSGINDHGYGMIFGMSDARNFYLFCVSGDGHYQIGYFSDNKWNDVISWTRSSAINTYDATNRLMIKKQGNTFLFYINDTYITQTSNISLPGAKIGFNINKTMRVLIDDVIVKESDTAVTTTQPYTPVTLPSSGDRVVFQDDFANNVNSWYETDTNDAYVKVSGGKYVFEHKRNMNSWSSWRSAGLDHSKDYTIQATFQKVSGVNDYGYGLIFGLSDANNFHSFTISDNGYYQVGYFSSGTWTDLISWTYSSVINRNNATNRLMIKRQGDAFLFYINDTYVNQTPHKFLAGEKIGFTLNKTMRVLIDDMIVKESTATITVAQPYIPPIIPKPVTPLPVQKPVAGLTSDVDTVTKRSGIINRDGIAVIIGNKDYKKAKAVDYAVNDAQAVKLYVRDVLGYQEGNIFYVENATKSDIEMLFGNKDSYKGKLFNAVKENRSDVFIYYSGHGAPGLKNKKGYFVPVEADPQYIELSGFPIDVFYQNLKHIPARTITVVLDACFSGGSLFEKISPLVIQVEKPVIDARNIVVLTSSQSEQVSTWYEEKNHGMFTYFFLKAIQNKNADTNGDGAISFSELYEYMADKTEGVPYYARRIHGIDQNPTIDGQYKNKTFIKY